MGNGGPLFEIAYAKFSSGVAPCGVIEGASSLSFSSNGETTINQAYSVTVQFMFYYVMCKNKSAIEAGSCPGGVELKSFFTPQQNEGYCHHNLKFIIPRQNEGYCLDVCGLDI